jgi:hypothetical protein
MIEMPLAREVWATLPAPEPALLEQVAMLHPENAALRVENPALQERDRELEAWLGQRSGNSSRRLPPIRRRRP